MVYYSSFYILHGLKESVVRMMMNQHITPECSPLSQSFAVKRYTFLWSLIIQFHRKGKVLNKSSLDNSAIRLADVRLAFVKTSRIIYQFSLNDVILFLLVINTRPSTLAKGTQKYVGSL